MPCCCGVLPDSVEAWTLLSFPLVLLFALFWECEVVLVPCDVFLLLCDACALLWESVVVFVTEVLLSLILGGCMLVLSPCPVFEGCAVLVRCGDELVPFDCCDVLLLCEDCGVLLVVVVVVVVLVDVPEMLLDVPSLVLFCSHPDTCFEFVPAGVLEEASSLGVELAAAEVVVVVVVVVVAAAGNDSVFSFWFVLCESL